MGIPDPQTTEVDPITGRMVPKGSSAATNDLEEEFKKLADLLDQTTYAITYGPKKASMAASTQVGVTLHSMSSKEFLGKVKDKLGYRVFGHFTLAEKPTNDGSIWVQLNGFDQIVIKLNQKQDEDLSDDDMFNLMKRYFSQ